MLEKPMIIVRYLFAEFNPAASNEAEGIFTMRRTSLVMLVLSAVLFVSMNSADARYRWYRGGYGYGGYGGAQTPMSANANAMANVIRAEGAYNVATSRAMINVERARGAYLANQRVAMDNYYAHKRALEADHAHTAEVNRASVQRYQEYVADQLSKSPRLSSTQLNPTTGQIAWPRALQQSAYNDHRKELEGFFSSRSKQSTSGDVKKMHDTIVAMRDELRDHIHDIVTNDYIESRKFLDLLMKEVDQPRG
jgi:hypothetical protein